MVIVPQTNIILLKTPMELSDNNQLTWSTLQEQYNYFYSLPKLILEEATYQRKEGEIRFPTNSTTTYEDLLQYNYCMYQNEAYDNKWFYAYITEVKYINDGMSTIKLETDVWNTWWNDITFKQSFVEREHVNDDTVGLHTVPENVETGEYLPATETIMNYGTTYAQPYYLCVGISENLLDSTDYTHQYNRVYSGIQYIVIRDQQSLNNLIKKYDNADKKDAIYCMFMIPGGFLDSGQAISWDTVEDIYYYIIPSSVEATEIANKTISRPTELGITNNKYTPKNNKLLTEQFIYILINNMSGSVGKFAYEYFNDPTACRFTIDGAITPGCSLLVYPVNYKNNTGLSEGIMASKLPICGWNSDVYTNWLTENGINIALSGISSGLQVIGGLGLLASGGGALAGTGMIANSGLSIASTIGQVYQHSLAPRQAEGNTNTGDIRFALNNFYPTILQMTIKEEYASIIDRYFDMYGYKVNSLKLPNIRGRLNWNYVKTIGCNLIGDIPQLDLQKIKNLFDNGITLWHHTNTFLDYSQNNNII